nr:MAG TPA: hypothetical protein [Bacteriophage sp.]
MNLRNLVKSTKNGFLDDFKCGFKSRSRHYIEPET